MLADVAQLEETERLISRPLGNFDDVAAVMDAINHFHGYEVTADMTIFRSEEAAALMGKYQPPLPRGLLDSIEAARYSFNRVTEHAKNAMNDLLTAQNSFSEKLTTSADEILAAKTNFINAFQTVSFRLSVVFFFSCDRYLLLSPF
ncbi:unnamed protein product [Dibothriocephalus latus]|uniref:Uncharacterized protein n=1 Tax=Dibothriocephalus latus TaxID=60516 RepID=A0A3P6Q1J5_DIBLA|nr:unnamed protein product [Dibothriocephalus latus]